MSFLKFWFYMDGVGKLSRNFCVQTSKSHKGFRQDSFEPVQVALWRAEVNVFSVTSSRIWSWFPAVSTRIGIHVSTWVPLIKEPGDKGMPLTTADFTAVCSTFHHHQERSSCEGQEATRRMVIPSIVMFIIPRGTLDPPLCPYLHAPYFKTLIHSEKRQAQENSRHSRWPSDESATRNNVHGGIRNNSNYNRHNFH